MSSTEADQRRRDWFHQALEEYLSMVVCKEPRFLVNDGFKQLDKIHAGGHTPALKNIPDDSGISNLITFSETRQTEDGWEKHAGRAASDFMNGALDYLPVSIDTILGRPAGSVARDNGGAATALFEAPEGKVIIGIELIDARGDGKNGTFSLVEASTYNARFKFTPQSFERQEWHVRLYCVDPLDFDKSAEEQYRHQWFSEARTKLAKKKDWMRGERCSSGKTRHLGFTKSSSLDASYSSDLRANTQTWKTETWSWASVASAFTNVMNAGEKNCDVVLTPAGPTDTIVGFEVTCIHAGGAKQGGTSFRVIEITSKKLHVWLEAPLDEDSEWRVDVFFVDSRLYH